MNDSVPQKLTYSEPLSERIFSTVVIGIIGLLAAFFFIRIGMQGYDWSYGIAFAFLCMIYALAKSEIGKTHTIYTLERMCRFSGKLPRPLFEK
jgi:hypothetical protein